MVEANKQVLLITVNDLELRISFQVYLTCSYNGGGLITNQSSKKFIDHSGICSHFRLERSYESMSVKTFVKRLIRLFHSQ